MSEFETITFERDDRGVAVITLAVPQKHNALSPLMLSELTGLVHDLTTGETPRVCMLQAQGKTFCAGGDLKWMQEQMGQSREDKIAGATKIAQLLRALDELPCPLIGKVEGPAYGGGIGMMAVCDVVIATDHTRFALTETRLGLIPATIGPYVVRRIGEPHARRYFFSSKPFDAGTAMQIGLVSQVCGTDEIDAVVENEIGTILKCLPGAVAEAKALVKTLARNPVMETLNYTATKLADRWESEEATTAIEAFFARQK